MPGLEFGINFRATEGFVDDGHNEFWNSGNAIPMVHKRGVTYLLSSGPLQARDRNSSLDRRLAGLIFGEFVNNSSVFVNIGLPRAGLWEIRLASGDPGNAHTGLITIALGEYTDLDAVDETVLGGEFTRISEGTLQGEYRDVTGFLHTSEEAWIANNRPIRHNFTLPKLVIKLSDLSDAADAMLNHLHMKYIGPRFAFTDRPTDVRFAPTRKVWTKKPLSPKVNFDHPLAKGLQLVVAPIDSAFADIGPFKVAATTTTSTMTAGEQGLAAKNAGAGGQRLQYEAPPGFGLDISMFILYRFNSDANGYLAQYGGTGNNPHLSMFNRGNGDVSVLIGGHAQGVSSVPQNTWIDHGCIRSQTNLKRLYYLGVEDADDTQAPDGGDAPITIGNRPDTAQGTDIDMALFMQWNRVLSAAEFLSLHDNPWQIFELQTVFAPFNEKLPDLAVVEKDSGPY